MKVKELIEILSKLDSEKDILLDTDNGYITDLGGVDENKMGNKEVYIVHGGD